MRISTNLFIISFLLIITTGYNLKVQAQCNPSATAFALSATCLNDVPEDNAYLQISEATNATHYNFVMGSNYSSGDANIGNATAFNTSNLPLKFATLPNPSAPQDYTIRIFDGASDCFTDVTVTLEVQDCSEDCNCIDYMYVNDVERDIVHKFQVDPVTGILSEIGNPWLDNINAPHGVVPDLNGFLFLGEKALADPIGSRLIKTTCDGQRVDTLFSGMFNGQNLTNLVTIDNILYSAGRNDNDVDAYDLCNQVHLGTVDLEGVTYNWELFEGEDGLLYSLDGLVSPLTIYQIPYDTSLYTLAGSHVVQPFLTTSLTLGADERFWGVDRDADGYWYVTVRNGSNTNPNGSYIYVLDPAGNVLTSIQDTNNDGVGFLGARGIIWCEDAQRLYSAANAEDCIAVIEVDKSTNPFTLTYNQTAGVPGGGSKDLSKLKECCPVPNRQLVDSTYCIPGPTTVFLNDFFTCDGVVCEGVWELVQADPNINFGFCDFSVEVDGMGGCGTFVKQSDGTGDRATCGAFEITVNIEFIIAPEATISDNQEVCTGGIPDLLVGTVAGTPTYQWQMSTTSCDAGFSDIPGATMITYQPPALTSTTYYRLLTNVNGDCSSGSCEGVSNCITVTVEDLNLCLPITITRN